MSKRVIKEIQKEVSNINVGVKMAFQKVGEEFSDHLDTINANTSEIEALTQAMYVLEEKIDKLNERIDEISVTKSFENREIPHTEFNLTVQEQEIFVTLYTSERFLSIKEIARLVGSTSETTQLIIKRLVSKKIPILKEVNGKETYYALDKYFKHLQAKQNLIKLSESVIRGLQT